MKRFHLDFETFGALGAVIVSMAALFIAWDQAVVMRQQQHASAWPYTYMEVNYDSNDDGNFIELNLSNPGVGPARVRSARITSGGEPVGNWWELIESTFPENMQRTIQFVSAESAVGVVGIGETRTIIKMHWPFSDEIDEAFGNYLNQSVSGEAPAIGLELCYCSVYGRCWTATSAPDLLGQDHEEVDTCEASPDFLSTFFVMPNGQVFQSETEATTPTPSNPEVQTK